MRGDGLKVSVLFNEPKLLKRHQPVAGVDDQRVSVLFNEPKLLKLNFPCQGGNAVVSFSALQRAEIAETILRDACAEVPQQVSVLFNEPKLLKPKNWRKY